MPTTTSTETTITGPLAACLTLAVVVVGLASVFVADGHAPLVAAGLAVLYTAAGLVAGVITAFALDLTRTGLRRFR